MKPQMNINDIIHYQPIVNVGVLGHVAHGKSTLVRQITGIKTQKHTNEQKTGRTIKLGYANVKIYQCPQCLFYYTKPSDVMTLNCDNCELPCTLENHISFVDAPGHEFLMTTMLNGAAVMDCAILVIAANEPVPQPQTQEHLIAADIMGINNILVIQNKIDTITYADVQQNATQIREWTQGTTAENSNIIPISAHTGANVQRVIEALAHLKSETIIDDSLPPIFACIRSFDINKPGSSIRDLQGGVIGGTLLQGTLAIGDNITIKPGLKTQNGYLPLQSKILSIQSEHNKLDRVIPGGLLALQTYIDPRFSAQDILVGSIIGTQLPEITQTLKLKYFLLKNTTTTYKFQKGDIIRVTYLSRTTNGAIQRIHKRKITLLLDDPLCIIDNCDKLSLSKEIEGHNRLIGVGKIEGVNTPQQLPQPPQLLGHRLPEYDVLVSEVMGDVCGKKSLKKTMIKLTPPCCHKQGGARTIWTNFNTISKEIGHPIEHFKLYVTAEIGTTTSLTAQNELLLYGSYRPGNFETVIRSYIRRYCKCGNCGNCDVNLEIAKNFDTITCKWCGNSSVINSITTQNSKKGKGGKLTI